MMIILLATAMTLAMLVATAFGFRQEAQRVRIKEDTKHLDALIRHSPRQFP